MIAATELRIGNYVSYCQPDDISIVKGIYSDVDVLLNWARVFTKDLFGIPLTEELLLKCGAKLEGSEWQIEYEDTTFIFEGSLGRGFYYTGGEGCKLSVLFYNLHELQNMFKALTGQELNVEL